MWFNVESLPPLPKAETVLSVAASLTASAVLFRSVVYDLAPRSVHEYLSSSLQSVAIRLSSRLTVVIEESDGLTANQMFQAANIFLGSNVQLSTTSRIKVLKPEKERNLAVTIDKNQELLDVFKGVKLRWVLVSSPVNKSVGSNKRGNSCAFERSEIRHFELSFHKRHRDMVLSFYLPYILEAAKAIKEEKKTLKLHTIDYNGTDYWGSINFDHPATFDTIAMDPEKKKMLIEDLEMFVARKEFYRSVGKAWKRGYLLYGPPGTGKSSMVAAMANYLKFNVYDMDLKEVQCNSDLRRLLIGTSNRSILVIEDIDRSFESVEDDKVNFHFQFHYIAIDATKKKGKENVIYTN